jgi:hypothetical protein
VLDAVDQLAAEEMQCAAVFAQLVWRNAASAL